MTKLSTRPEIAVVIVTYKTRDLLLGCLGSLYAEGGRQGLNLRVIVVDNASGDGTVEAVGRDYPQAELIANAENLGPAKAFNLGVARALAGDGAYILLMNSDIEVLPGTLGAMHQYLEAQAEVQGVCGPLLNQDRSRQMSKTHLWNLRAPDFTKRFRVDFVGTTFALIRAGAFRRLGGYDENYYFYNEDLDWATRAKRAHLLLMYLPEAPVVHFQGRGSTQNRSKIKRALYASNVYYFKKFYPGLAWLVMRFMAMELNGRQKKLGREARNAAGEDERQACLQDLADIIEARKLMYEEYRRRRPPSLPDWGRG